MLIIKFIPLYIGIVLSICPFLACMLESSETREEQKDKPKFPKKTFIIMFIIGFVIFCIGLFIPL